MPRSKKRAKECQPKGELIIAAAVFIAAAVVSYELIGFFLAPGSSAGFSAFKRNFDSAPRVAIYAAAYNGTALSSTDRCASAIIESIISSSQQHRNASTIDLFIVNSTSCMYARGLGTGNGSVSSVGACLNMSKGEPTIYINYSATSTKSAVEPDYLYTSGNSTFLGECGIATEIS
jgi:hypothetical protein